jgi:2-polyprenyl-6-methoxyphenol hydroxylase-like FAD-dependent oxidoreductase
MNPNPERATSSHKRLRVLIIGAGTGGSCLAHGLKRAGIEVAVFERDRTRQGGLQGYRVGISPGGSRALAECLPSDLYATFVATCARTPRYFNMLTEQLREVLFFDERDAPLSSSDPVNSEKSVSRMTLRQVLLTGLEDVVQFDKKFVRYQQHENGTVTAYFEDGTEATGDVLIAADGTNSRVRKQLLPHARQEDSGILAIGGKLPITPESKALLSPKMFEGISMVLAPKGYSLIIHVLEFKWDRNGTKSGIGGNDAELIGRWPGLLFDNTLDHISWGFAAARQHFQTDPLKLEGAALMALTLEMTKGWHPKLRRLFELTDPTTVFPINIRTSEPVEPWPTSPVTLLGDAIHTMTPGRGIGANTALRDAALLCKKLVAVRDGTMPLLQGIAEYEEKMRRYGFEAVLKSREQMNGEGPMNKPVIGDAMLFAMRTAMRVINAIPPFKRRFAASMMYDRGVHQD